jgi:hypothetical protein
MQQLHLATPKRIAAAATGAYQYNQSARSGLIGLASARIQSKARSHAKDGG